MGTAQRKLVGAVALLCSGAAWAGAALAAQGDRSDWLLRVERARQASAAYIGAAVARRASSFPSLTDSWRNADAPDQARTDPTLRYGDIIVLENRLVVYKGESGHAPELGDFVDLQGAMIGGLHDAELRAIDAAVRTAAQRRIVAPSMRAYRYQASTDETVAP